MMRVRNSIAALVTVIVAALPALAHDHATGVVKERMEMMEAMAKPTALKPKAKSL